MRIIIFLISLASYRNFFVRRQLLANSAILFAGYKVPHPLNPYFELKIQTDGSLTPTAALEKASNELIALAKTIQNKFVIEFQYSEREQDALGAGANLGGMGTIGRIGDGIDGTYGDEAAWSGKDYLNDI